MLAAAVAVLFGAETAFLLFSGVGINSYSGSFFPVTAPMARLKAVVGSGLIGFDTGDPSQSRKMAHAGIFPEANLGYGLAEFAAYDPLASQAYFMVQSGAPYVEPDIDSAALARRYGIEWILLPDVASCGTTAGHPLCRVVRRRAPLRGPRLVTFLPGQRQQLESLRAGVSP